MKRGWSKRPDETKLAAFAMIFGVWLLVPVNSVQSPGLALVKVFAMGVAAVVIYYLGGDYAVVLLGIACALYTWIVMQNYGRIK